MSGFQDVLAKLFKKRSYPSGTYETEMLIQDGSFCKVALYKHDQAKPQDPTRG